MSSTAVFTDEEIAKQSSANAQAMALALIAHGRKHGESPDSVGRWLGALFAPSWAGIKGQGARRAATTAALNFVSIGAELRELDGDERQAHATLANWPSTAALDAFDLSQGETDAMYAVFEPIATYLGLAFRWERDGDTVTLHVEQPS